MDYKRIEEIKAELDNDKEVSLAMLMDLKAFLNSKINNWGKENKTYRIF